eukprot:12882374-Prorocentrum_lima.AAC.1
MMRTVLRETTRASKASPEAERTEALHLLLRALPQLLLRSVEGGEQPDGMGDIMTKAAQDRA